MHPNGSAGSWKIPLEIPLSAMCSKQWQGYIQATVRLQAPAGTTDHEIQATVRLQAPPGTADHDIQATVRLQAPPGTTDHPPSGKGSNWGNC